MNKTKVRDSNLELYRIIVMLLIIAHHYVVNSGLVNLGGPISQNPMSLRSIFLLLFGAWGKTGINCFVLITGYFMCKSQITLKKFAKLFLQIMFYRFVFYFIFLLTSYEPFSVGTLLKAVIPVRSIENGFSPAFLMFFLSIPFLNILVRNMNEKQHILLLLLLSFIYIFLGTMPTFSVKMNYVSWFAVLYFISSYIRLYPKKIFENKRLWAFLTVFFVLVASASVIVCSYLSVMINQPTTKTWYFFVQDSNTALAVLIGVSSFMLFKNLKIKNSKIINTISSTCFGVLLIHANSDAMRRWLWVDVLNNVGVYSSPWLFVHAILSVFAIFAVCSLIDLARIKFIEKPFFAFYDKKYDKILNWYKDKEEKIMKKLHIGEN